MCSVEIPVMNLKDISFMKSISTVNELLESANAFKISRIILTAVELRIFDSLSGHAFTSEEVAARTGTDPRATDRLLNVLAGTGLVVKANDRFSNSGLAEKHLVSSCPDFLGGLDHTAHLFRTWTSLTGAVRQGTSVAGISDSINDREPDWLESFIAAMHSRGMAQGKELASMIDLSRTSRTLDVGGGSGAFTFAFIEKNPEIHGVILDLPKVTPITKKYIYGAGLAERVTTIDGDYLVDDFGVNFDLVLMSAIIHINNSKENRLLIQKGADTLNQGGHLVIMDHVMQEDRTEPIIGAIFAINMLVGTVHGDTYTEKEIRSWMEDAGLSDVRLQTAPSGMQFMIGRKR